jgi:predicted ATP-dependent serine protease
LTDCQKDDILGIGEKENKMCNMCGVKSIEGFGTCGSSYCQEYDYYRNVAKNARKNSLRQKDALKRMQEIDAIIAGQTK